MDLLRWRAVFWHRFEKPLEGVGGCNGWPKRREWIVQIPLMGGVAEFFSRRNGLPPYASCV
jgi:hypothetical protein